MTKNFKLVLALVLSIMMVLGLMSALADPATAKITINDTVASYTYKAFQIFSGDLNGTTLSNIDWGSGINGSALLTALQADDTFETGTPATNLFAGKTTARQVAEAMDDSTVFTDTMATRFALLAGQNTTGDGTSLARKSDNSGYEATVNVGYYLVKNTSVPASTDTTNTGAYTNIILKVVGDATANPKRNDVTVDKKVGEKNDSSDTGTTAVDDVYADYDVGDDVPFKLTATTAANVSTYKKYHVTFEDTQSGFKAPTEFSVTVGSNSAVTLNSENSFKQEITDSANKVKITVEKDGEITATAFKIKVTFESTETGAVVLGAYDSTTITVDYTAELDTTAVRGNPGNPNKVKLVFSNNPNAKDDSEDTTGETPEKTVVVFTYDLDFDKIVKNTAGNAYEAKTGAGFTLYKKLATAPTGDDLTAHPACTETSYTNYYKVKEITSGSNFKFDGLDAGDYVLVETTTPDGYNTIDPIGFSISATIASDANLPNGYKLTALTGPSGWSSNVGTGTSDGKIDLSFTRKSASTGEDETVTTKIDGTTNKLDSGEIFGQILNEAGVTLPETGGIGTTIFYVAGSLMVLAAAILLITKRRMGAND